MQTLITHIINRSLQTFDIEHFARKKRRCSPRISIARWMTGYMLKGVHYTMRFNSKKLLQTKLTNQMPLDNFMQSKFYTIRLKEQQMQLWLLTEWICYSFQTTDSSCDIPEQQINTEVTQKYRHIHGNTHTRTARAMWLLFLSRWGSTHATTPILHTIELCHALCRWRIL